VVGAELARDDATPLAVAGAAVTIEQALTLLRATPKRVAALAADPI
jgi:hypothetical protein